MKPHSFGGPTGNRTLNARISSDSSFVRWLARLRSASFCLPVVPALPPPTALPLLLAARGVVVALARITQEARCFRGGFVVELGYEKSTR